MHPANLHPMPPPCGQQAAERRHIRLENTDGSAGIQQQWDGNAAIDAALYMGCLRTKSERHGYICHRVQRCHRSQGHPAAGKEADSREQKKIFHEIGTLRLTQSMLQVTTD